MKFSLLEKLEPLPLLLGLGYGESVRYDFDPKIPEYLRLKNIFLHMI